MGLIEKKVFGRGGCSLFLWKMEESLEDLEKRWHPHEGEWEFYSCLKTERRKKEWVSARVFLQEEFGAAARILYAENGRPELNGVKGEVSISHSGDWLAIIHGQHRVAVDLQEYTPKVMRIARKFVREEEGQALKEWPEIKGLNLVWAAKEALFKWYSPECSLAFIKDMRLTLPRHFAERGVIHGEVQLPQGWTTTELCFEFLEDFVLAYLPNP